MHSRDRLRTLIAVAIVAASSFGWAEDLRKDYAWIQAEGLPPRIGTQPKNPDDRTMSYDYLFMECNRRGQVIITAWPLTLRGRASKGALSAKLVMDSETYALPNPRKSFNEMDSVWQITAKAPDLTVIRNLQRASRVRLSGTGITPDLPPASRDVDAFLQHCEQIRG